MSKVHDRGSRALLGLILAALGASACSDLPPPPIGQMQLALSSGVGDAQYRLSRASFAITGAAELNLDSDDEPESDTLERALPAGDYAVELLPGWQLERRGPLGLEPVSAELASQNPLAFAISPGGLTTLTFQFRTTAGSAAAAGDGRVRIGVAVDGVGAPAVVISELMKNPEALPDAEGEWIELYNAGTEAVALEGCTLARDDAQITLDGSVIMAPGTYLTFANGTSPGFVADVHYSGLTLPNSGAFRLQLSCGEQLLDAVSVDPAALANGAGRSLSLSRASFDAVANDTASNWCEGAQSYNGDLGTPGAENPDCAQ